PYVAVLCVFNDPATTAIYTLSLHDALPISVLPELGGGADQDAEHAAHALEVRERGRLARQRIEQVRMERVADPERLDRLGPRGRSEEHTSELQSRENLVCRLLLEKKKKHTL